MLGSGLRCPLAEQLWEMYFILRASVSLTMEGTGHGFVYLSVRIECRGVRDGLASSCPLLGLGVVSGAPTVRFPLP